MDLGVNLNGIALLRLLDYSNLNPPTRNIIQAHSTGNHGQYPIVLVVDTISTSVT
jgi:hypothetical protein